MDIDAAFEKLCSRVKELRQQADLKQTDFLEDRVDVDARNIRRIENLELKDIQIKTLFKICKVLKIHPRELFDFPVEWAKPK
jgi:DNA-binding Xre family transcriptional regulator